MSVEITNNRIDFDRRFSNVDLRVYVNDTPLHKIADKWFSDNGLYSLPVKSKAWNRIIKYLNDRIAPELAKHFNVPIERCKWNRKCGCSCGCSPGFVIKMPPPEFQRRDVWVKVSVNESVIRGLKELIVSEKFVKIFNKDKEQAELEKVH